MKVFVHAPREDWIVDRIVSEFKRGNSDIVCDDSRAADVIWAPAGWCVDQLRDAKAPVISTVHHLYERKPEQAAYVAMNDHLVSEYHVPNQITKLALQRVTSKPVTVIPYWVSNETWHPVTPEERSATRASLGISPTVKLIGSFQRDTEGRDGVSPKLEKGPDIFCEYVESCALNASVAVLLCGYRRQYVTHRLRAAGVKIIYIERAPVSAMRWLYGALDLYVVSSRCEGGPQALLECAACCVPVISTPVGVASDVLAPESISADLKSAVPNVAVAAERVAALSSDLIFARYREMLVSAKRRSS